MFDRVKETTTSTGTGNITLAGAATGYVSFGSVYSVGDEQVPYVIQGTSDWEVGLGTYSATNTLRRDRVLASSNAGSLVNFGAGTRDVFVTAAADVLDVTGKKVALIRGLAMP